MELENMEKIDLVEITKRIHKVYDDTKITGIIINLLEEKDYKTAIVFVENTIPKKEDLDLMFLAIWLWCYKKTSHSHWFSSVIDTLYLFPESFRDKRLKGLMQTALVINKKVPNPDAEKIRKIIEQLPEPEKTTELKKLLLSEIKESRLAHAVKIAKLLKETTGSVLRKSVLIKILKIAQLPTKQKTEDEFG